ncbi:hypothetical protein CAPTEDRAFT_201419 [Capitella teleta]|uniref:Spondin domain-containing protein n=1 Tax=Capitella teleta TaxID=283909 RepID=R7THB4_CAPTE|nr:hypothetical protein CAPTEDRAFT_201419 [Capitella teleta]|eukprot:ELT93198.1 hypothetical protein CAPTEDRAFT_201419 [Capitella teleta]
MTNTQEDANLTIMAHTTQDNAKVTTITPTAQEDANLTIMAHTTQENAKVTTMTPTAQEDANLTIMAHTTQENAKVTTITTTTEEDATLTTMAQAQQFNWTNFDEIATTPLADTSPTNEFDLEWDVWTPWSSCYSSNITGLFEKMRIKLCSVALDKSGASYSSCTHELNGTIDQLDVNLYYAVETSECIPDLDRFWSVWSRWSTCSAFCGQGTRVRQRTCTGQYGNGRQCSGESTQNEFCDQTDCSQEASPAGHILRRREELLPTVVYTESDSYPSIIRVSTSIIVPLVLLMLIIPLLDFVTRHRYPTPYCWTALKQRNSIAASD